MKLFEVICEDFDMRYHEAAKHIRVTCRIDMSDWRLSMK